MEQLVAMQLFIFYTLEEIQARVPERANSQLSKYVGLLGPVT